MSDLVGNREDRFSHNEAHFVAKIWELETQLVFTQDDLNSLQDNLNREWELWAHTRSEFDREKVQMEETLQGLNEENETLKAEVYITKTSLCSMKQFLKVDDIFRCKNVIFFLIFAQNIDCGYIVRTASLRRF